MTFLYKDGLEQLCDEFDEEEYQYAFARVTGNY